MQITTLSEARSTMRLDLCRATREEARRPLPGDDLIAVPRAMVTHAVTIDAPAPSIWPWLAQLGAGRGGWYSYDRVDNGGARSATEIIAAYQRVEPGQIMPAVPGAEDAFIAREVDPGKSLVLVAPVASAADDPHAERRMRGPLRVSWALVIEPAGDGRSRLLTRGRISSDWLARRAGHADPERRAILIERVYRVLAAMPWRMTLPIALAGHYLMESRMLRGIKRRAEDASKEARKGRDRADTMSAL